MFIKVKQSCCGTNFALGLILGLLLIMTFSSMSHAKITRGCNAWYEIEVISVNGKAVSDIETFRVEQFKSTRGCGNAVPNRCRRRARDTAHLCMSEHWGAATTSKVQSCRNPAITNYGTGNLKRAIKNRSCDFISERGNMRGRNPYRISVIGRTVGGKDCGKNVTLSTSFQFNCP